MLEKMQTQAIQKVLEVINYAEKNKLTNENTFINFLDDLNDLSIRY